MKRRPDEIEKYYTRVFHNYTTVLCPAPSDNSCNYNQIHKMMYNMRLVTLLACIISYHTLIHHTIFGGVMVGVGNWNMTHPIDIKNATCPHNDTLHTFHTVQCPTHLTHQVRRTRITLFSVPGVLRTIVFCKQVTINLYIGSMTGAW